MDNPIHGPEDLKAQTILGQRPHQAKAGDTDADDTTTDPQAAEAKAHH